MVLLTAVYCRKQLITQTNIDVGAGCCEELHLRPLLGILRMDLVPFIYSMRRCTMLYGSSRWASVYENTT